jgi:hypothetical protein
MADGRNGEAVESNRSSLGFSKRLPKQSFGAISVLFNGIDNRLGNLLLA